MKQSKDRCWRWLTVIAVVAAQLALAMPRGSAQTVILSAPAQGVTKADPKPPQDEPLSLARYVDPANGMTADNAVAYALAHNGELLAARQELEAARALIRQARLRPNPQVEATGSRQIAGADNSVMVTGMLPLELGGRRATRITVAQREAEMREGILADRERTLAAEVRAKFGEALAAALKLGFVEELLATSRRGYRLVAARVVEGRTPPLEENMVLVEVNRLRSMREMNEGKIEVALLELRNWLGMNPDEPLRLRGDFTASTVSPPSLNEATTRALRERPDVLAARAAEDLAGARIEQARSGGRFDASLKAGYQRMNSSFPLSGIGDRGQLTPVQDVFHFFTFGVTLDVPVRNKNQGAIEATVAEAEAAKRRREFTELTVRREVAAAHAQYERAAKAMEIFRVGVRGQANKNLDVIRQTYELGSKTLLDYVAEQRRFIEVETAYIDAILEAYLARVAIERAAASPELIKR